MATVDLERIEYADEFSETISSRKPLTLEDVVQAANIMKSPSWIGILFSLRDSIVRWFGIKTKEDYRPSSGNRSSVAMFPILQQNADRIVAGDDDRHLNFRVIIRLQEQSNGIYRLSFRTLVQFNNMIGRIYFLPVKPLHRIIVPVMLKRLQAVIISGKYQTLR